MNLTENDYQKISHYPLFEGIALGEVKKLLTESQIVTHSHRKILYEMGDRASSFAVVFEGAYKLVKPTASGDDFIMYFATPGEAIAALVMGQEREVQYPIRVKSIGTSKVCVIPRSTFNNFWKVNPQILLRLNSLLFTRMGFLQDEKSLIRAPLAQRISWFLLKMLEKNNDEGGEHILPLPLTRQEIADHLGVTVESVIRIMSQWSQEGIIRSADRQIEIVRVDYLVELLKEIA